MRRQEGEREQTLGLKEKEGKKRHKEGASKSLWKMELKDKFMLM